MATDFARTATNLVKELKTHLEANDLGGSGSASGGSGGAVGSGGGVRGGVLRDPGQALPAYKEDEVSKSAREVQEHYDSVVAILGAFREENREWDTRPEVASTVLIHHQSLLRNKRLLLAYQNLRLERIKAFRWKCGRLPRATQDKLSAPERDFVKSYERILNSYQKQCRVDLTVGFFPPGENLLKVRVTEDLGVMEFDYIGEADLQVGTVHLLPHEEAERLIIEGKLEHLA